MTDTLFYPCASPLTLEALAELVGGELRCSPPARTQVISGVGDLTVPDHLHPHDLVYIRDKRWLDKLGEMKAGVCLLKASWAELTPAQAPLLLVAEPIRALQKIADVFFPEWRLPAGQLGPGIDATATVHKTARIHPSACIGPRATIGAQVTVGPYTVIGSGCSILEGTHIGSHVGIFYTYMGPGCTILNGAQIGTAGFGFLLDPTGHQDIPQLGRVIIESDVTVGANTTIDRGALGDTVIRQGCRIDNLVQIAHNVVLGRGVVMAAQCGISGSTQIGDMTIMGGQVGIADHITIGQGVQIAAQSGLMRDVEDGQKIGGSPAVPMGQWMRQNAALSRLVNRRKTEIS